MRIFLIGLPRSGTTWVANAVAAAPGVHYVHEPDNQLHEPLAHLGLRGLDWIPAVAPGRRSPRFERMWDVAFAGSRPTGHAATLATRLALSPRTPRLGRIWLLTALAEAARRRVAPGDHQLVKSTRAYLSVEWIAERYRPQVVVVWRSPLNMLASHLEQGWVGGAVSGLPAVRERFTGTEAWPPPAVAGTEAAVWDICAAQTILLETAARHPDWTLVRHEALCADPSTGYRRLLETLGLQWTDEVETFLTNSDRPGSGWEVRRVAGDQVDSWRRRLSPEHAEVAQEVMARFARSPGSPLRECLQEARD